MAFRTAFRKTVFWAHLVTGVTAGLVVLMMSATGILLTYERQILAWVDSREALSCRDTFVETPPRAEARAAIR